MNLGKYVLFINRRVCVSQHSYFMISSPFYCVPILTKHKDIMWGASCSLANLLWETKSLTNADLMNLILQCNLVSAVLFRTDKSFMIFINQEALERNRGCHGTLLNPWQEITVYNPNVDISKKKSVLNYVQTSFYSTEIVHVYCYCNSKSTQSFLYLTA